MANYQFVIDSHFQPFTMQEMLTPFAMYKEAFEKTEEAYNELSTKADVFKELSNGLPEDSKARQLYEGYANDLKAQAEDLARNGLSMGNRKALTALKRRYAGEIGVLDQAKTKMDEAIKTRNALMATGKPILYATQNFTIDQFLGSNTPNMYMVNQDDLYSKGAQRGKAISSRMYGIEEGGEVMGGYYQFLKETVGMPQDRINAYMQSDEFNQMVDKYMEQVGAASNLSAEDYRKARQSFVEGVYDGLVYQEKNTVQQNLGKITAADQARINLEQEKNRITEDHYRRQMALSERNQVTSEIATGIVYDPKTGTARYVAERDPKMEPYKWMYDFNADGSIKGPSNAFKEKYGENARPEEHMPGKSSNNSSGGKSKTKKTVAPVQGTFTFHNGEASQLGNISAGSSVSHGQPVTWYQLKEKVRSDSRLEADFENLKAQIQKDPEEWYDYMYNFFIGKDGQITRTSRGTKVDIDADAADEVPQPAVGGALLNGSGSTGDTQI